MFKIFTKSRQLVRGLSDSFGQKYFDAIDKGKVLLQIYPKELDYSTYKNMFVSPQYITQGQPEIKSIEKLLLSPAHDIIARGGKRWRILLIPIFTEMISQRNIADTNSNKDILFLAALNELVHHSTLIIDDIQDGSLVRRGKPAIHVKYGLDASLNAAFMMMLSPLSKMNEYIPKQKLEIIRQICLDGIMGLYLGQTWDVNWAHLNYIPTENEYMISVGHRTGGIPKFTLKALCNLLDLDEKYYQMIPKLGEALGIGMQINNDVYDLYNSLDQTGKDIVGEDISDGKKTLLVLHSYSSNKNSSQSARLKTILEMKTKDPELVQEAISILKSTNSIEYAKKVGNELMLKTWDEIKPHFPDNQARRDMDALLDYHVNRLHKIT
jgi:geranylgeranyl pyrophosphate synthase